MRYSEIQPIFAESRGFPEEKGLKQKLLLVCNFAFCPLHRVSRSHWHSVSLLCWNPERVHQSRALIRCLPKVFDDPVGQFIQTSCAETFSVLLIQYTNDGELEPSVMQLKDSAFNADKKVSVEALFIVDTFCMLSTVFGTGECVFIKGLVGNTRISG